MVITKDLRKKIIRGEIDLNLPADIQIVTHNGVMWLEDDTSWKLYRRGGKFYRRRLATPPPEPIRASNDLFSGLSEILTSASPFFEDLRLRQEEARRQWVEQNGPHVRFRRTLMEDVWEIEDGVEGWIAKSPVWDAYDEMSKGVKNNEMAKQMFTTGYCGYVWFREKPIIEPDIHGIVGYIPVHGGITLAEHDESGSVFGFDTTHSNSYKYPVRDKEWIKQQINLMLEGIRLAAKLEPEYLDAFHDNHRKLEVIEPLFKLRGGDPEPNFLMMLNMLSGDL